jgi:hypothetical protein
MAAIAICSSMILVIHTQHNHGTNQMIEHVLVGSMDATAHNAKHDKRKNMKQGQTEE